MIRPEFWAGSDIKAHEISLESPRQDGAALVGSHLQGLPAWKGLEKSESAETCQASGRSQGKLAEARTPLIAAGQQSWCAQLEFSVMWLMENLLNRFCLGILKGGLVSASCQL